MTALAFRASSGPQGSVITSIIEGLNRCFPTSTSSSVPSRSIVAAVEAPLTRSQPVFTCLGSIASGVRSYQYRLEATTSAHRMVSDMMIPCLVVPIPLPRVEDAWEVRERFEVSVRPISAALREIEELTGLNHSDVALRLLGVTRPTFYAWMADKAISLDNELRARDVLDVLQRVHQRLGSPELVRGWLTTPMGIRAEVPLDLIRTGRVDAARLLAVSSVPRRDKPLPAWILETPPHVSLERLSTRHSVGDRLSFRALDEAESDEGDL